MVAKIIVFFYQNTILALTDFIRFPSQLYIDVVCILLFPMKCFLPLNMKLTILLIIFLDPKHKEESKLTAATIDVLWGKFKNVLKSIPKCSLVQLFQYLSCHFQLYSQDAWEFFLNTWILLDVFDFAVGSAGRQYHWNHYLVIQFFYTLTLPWMLILPNLNKAQQELFPRDFFPRVLIKAREAKRVDDSWKDNCTKKSKTFIRTPYILYL